MRYVKVQYTSTLDNGYGGMSGKYIYKDELKTPLKPFDVVIVPTQYGFALAIVKQVDLENGYSGCTKSVAERIDSPTINKSLSAQRVASIKKQLDAKLKTIDEVERYRRYADASPEIAELVKQLEEVTSHDN